MDGPEAAHEHVFVEKETGACDDGHRFVISVCECNAEKHEWPETEEYIVSDWLSAHRSIGFKAVVTHHYGALFLLTKGIFVSETFKRIATSTRETRQQDPGLN